MTQRASKAVALSASERQARILRWGLAALTGIGALLVSVGVAGAESHETIIVSHGYNEYDELKYSPEDPHLDDVRLALRAGPILRPAFLHCTLRSPNVHVFGP